jgi:hypothetical protein
LRPVQHRADTNATSPASCGGTSCRGLPPRASSPGSDRPLPPLGRGVHRHLTTDRPVFESAGTPSG